MSQGMVSVPQHDLYFTIGETVGQPGARFPDMGLKWHYTPPPVFLPEWPPVQADLWRHTRPYPTGGGKGQEGRWSSRRASPQREARGISGLCGSPITNLDATGIGFVPGTRRRRRRPASGGERLEYSACMDRQFGTRGLPCLHPAIARRAQRCQALLRVARQRLDKRPHALLFGQRQACGDPAHWSKQLLA